jgi:hypothetical protein
MVWVLALQPVVFQGEKAETRNRSHVEYEQAVVNLRDTSCDGAATFQTQTTLFRTWCWQQSRAEANLSCVWKDSHRSVRRTAFHLVDLAFKSSAEHYIIDASDVKAVRVARFEQGIP